MKAQYYYGRLSQDQIKHGGVNLTSFPLQLLVNLCLKIILLVNLWLQQFFGSDVCALTATDCQSQSDWHHAYERIDISDSSLVNL